MTGQFGELCQWLQGHDRLLNRDVRTVFIVHADDEFAPGGALEALEVLAAVYVDDFAGAEGEGAFGDGDAGEGHVLRQAEAADGG